MGPDGNGKMAQIRDHSSTDSSVQAMKLTMVEGVPIVLIAGKFRAPANPGIQNVRECQMTGETAKDNTLIPTEMPHEYQVLDYFHVTDIWAEKNDKKICYKFRFEKCNLTEQSWWAAAGSQEPREPDYSAQHHWHRCSSCHVDSFQVLEVWVCLNATCDEFWKRDDGSAPTASQSKYSHMFLSKRTQWPSHQTPPFKLRPDLFQGDPNDPGVTYSKASWRGMCCPKCGCCSSRVKWDRWECSAPDCDFVHIPLRFVVSAFGASLRNPPVVFHGLALPLNMVNHDFVTSVTTQRLGDYRLTRYELLPGNFIYHFASNLAVWQERDGPDELFVALQQYDIGLKRRMLGGRKGKATSAEGLEARTLTMNR